MSDHPAGWYRNPKDPTVARYWDGESWVGEIKKVENTPLKDVAEPTPSVIKPTSVVAQASADGESKAPVCYACGGAPASVIKLESASSRIIYWKYGKIKTVLCAKCAEVAYYENQVKTLILGWWGPISALATVWITVANRFRISKHRRDIPSIVTSEGTFVRPRLKAHTNLAAVGCSLVALVIIIAIGAGANSEPARDAQIGDCILSVPIAATATPIASVEVVPCSSSHSWQVIYTGTLSDSVFNQTVIDQEALNFCKQQINSSYQSWNTQLQTEYENATSYIFYPSSDSWNRGDRTIDCLIGSPSQSFSDSVILQLLPAF